MGDNHGVATVSAFRIAMFVLLISYLALAIILFVDLLACIDVVKLASAYVLLTLLIKLTQKLLNILINLTLQ
jgi:hypothetical protein